MAATRMFQEEEGIISTGGWGGKPETHFPENKESQGVERQGRGERSK